MDLQFYWHMYHDIIVAPAAVSFVDRVKDIEEHKPLSERELRLKLLKPVQGVLPPAVIEAGAPIVQAWAKFRKTGNLYDHGVYSDAVNAYKEVVADNLPAIKALHAKECPDCPWNGETIFPEKENNA